MHSTPLTSPLGSAHEASPVLDSKVPGAGPRTAPPGNERPLEPPPGCRVDHAVHAERDGPRSAHESEVAPTPLCDLLVRLFGSRAGGHARSAALLDRASIGVLSRMDVSGLVAMGLTGPQAERLACAFELGRRVESHRRRPAASLRHPSEVVARMAPILRGLEQETFHALLLDARHRLLHRVLVSAGTLTTSLVHPREVFREAIRRSAAALVVVHNHPSGDPEPSQEDRAVTRRLIEVGELLGIPLLDHVVVGDDRWVSLRERMPFPTSHKAT